MDQFEGDDASDLYYHLIVDPGLDHQISRIPDMLFKEPDQPVGSLSLRLLKLQLPFCLPELDLQFFLFPNQLVDPGIPFRHFLFLGHLGQCDVYVLDGDVAQCLAYVDHHISKLIILCLGQLHPPDHVVEGVRHLLQFLLDDLLRLVPVSPIL